ncbi:MAG: Sec-independent protein translocase protein TatB [Zoogloeaceae bacterium]|jgi:sec-independent protein translocase protein TatB|nr:Sec-independent protein translocase protein TatB [Zoogloeaceae bacterium]
MFEVGFTEMLVIAIVALVVIGPERLPAVAKVVGRVMGQLRRYASEFRAEIDREVQLSELKQLRQEATSSVQQLQASLHASFHEAETAVADVKKTAEEAMKTKTPPAASAENEKIAVSQDRTP